ncbi:MAG: hypothetical protein A2Y10_02465 [Planctomycetes bacterium GWF2_41_51]|nr:MAG: hypothetical protein A2Y10_02465 [Planctomycetes bacterium GWF2_41_51]HBG25669.1 hypothetical protein [Phycisphaerales bacterium]
MILQLADKIVDTLNDGSFVLPFTAVRTLFPFYELKDLSTLRVTVVPKSVNITTASRSSSEYDYQVDIAIQKAVKTPDDAEITVLAELVLAIAKNFRNKVYQDIGAVCFKQSVDPLYSVEHIQPPSVFTSVVTLNFKVIE